MLNAFFLQILELLSKMLSALPLTEQNILKPAQLTFWLKTAVPLIFDGDAAIQDAAIETFEKVIPFLMMSNYHSHPDWQKTKRDTVNRYERIFYDNSIFDRNLNYKKKSIPFQVHKRNNITISTK